MVDTSPLKALLLDMLEQIFPTGGEIQATQQMGVQLSNAVKREGVVIIQNQHVEVLSHIVPKIAQAIRICDSLSIPALPTPIPSLPLYEQPIEIAPSLPEPDPIQACCEKLFKDGTSWEGMQVLMRQRYMVFILEKFGTKAEAAAFLKIHSSYLSKLTSEKEFSR